MPETKNLLIIVNSGDDKPYNQYAAYVVAFMAKHIGKIDKVTVFYGPQGVRMTKKGELAKLAITPEVKELIAGQLEGVSAGDLPDNLEPHHSRGQVIVAYSVLVFPLFSH